MQFFVFVKSAVRDDNTTLGYRFLMSLFMFINEEEMKTIGFLKQLIS